MRRTWRRHCGSSAGTKAATSIIRPIRAAAPTWASRSRPTGATSTGGAPAAIFGIWTGPGRGADLPADLLGRHPRRRPRRRHRCLGLRLLRQLRGPPRHGHPAAPGRGEGRRQPRAADPGGDPACRSRRAGRRLRRRAPALAAGPQDLCRLRHRLDRPGGRHRARGAAFDRRGHRAARGPPHDPRPASHRGPAPRCGLEQPRGLEAHRHGHRERPGALVRADRAGGLAAGWTVGIDPRI
jgi:hypothetical protein